MAVQAQTMTIQENLGFTVQDLLMDDASGFNNIVLLQQPKPNMMTIQSDQLHDFSPYKNQNNTFVGNGSSMGYDLQSMSSLQSHVSAHIDKQRFDLDQLLSLQEQRLRHALQEQRKQQLSMLMNRYESKARLLIEQKDEEISKASKRTLQLQEYIRRMEIEKLKWQRLAKEKEATVESLNNSIEKLRENVCFSETAADDAESCCFFEHKDQRLDNINVDQEDKHARIDNGKMMLCRSCKNRRSCVVFLPCRHLCSCKDCEAWLYSCPVCKEEKKASIDVLF